MGVVDTTLPTEDGVPSSPPGVDSDYISTG